MTGFWLPIPRALTQGKQSGKYKINTKLLLTMLLHVGTRVVTSPNLFTWCQVCPYKSREQRPWRGTDCLPWEIRLGDPGHKQASLKKCFWKDHLIQAECFPSGCWCPGVSRVFLLRMLTEHWTQKSSTKPYKAASIPISRAIRAHSTFTFHQGPSHFNEWFFIPSLYFIAIWRKRGWISAWLAQTSRRIWVGLIPDKHLSFSHVSSVLTPPLEQCVYRGPGEAGGMWTTPAMCEDNGWP